MSTNYYVKIKPQYLTQQEVDDMISAHREIHSLLMEKAKSSNINVQEWANEQLHNLSQTKLSVPHDKIHIGKSSIGHRFTLSAKHSTWSEWTSYLQAVDGVIVDEYDDEVSLENLSKLVMASLKSEIHFPQQKLSEDGFYLVDGEFC